MHCFRSGDMRETDRRTDGRIAPLLNAPLVGRRHVLAYRLLFTSVFAVVISRGQRDLLDKLTAD